MGSFYHAEGSDELPHITVSLPITVDFEDLDRLEAAVEDGPDGLSATVTSVIQSTEQVKVDVHLQARGASKYSITRLLEDAGIRYVTGRVKIVKG